MNKQSSNKQEALLRVESVVVGYDRPLHQPLNFKVDAGDIILLHGDNGAGKSSFVGALASTVKLWQGQIIRAPQLSIALQPQQPVQRKGFPLTVLEYLAIAGCSPKLPEKLQHLQSMAVSDLSYGQLHLLAIWVAIHSTAQLVLLDEPTNHLDKQAKAQVLFWLDDLRPDQAAIMISHDAHLSQKATQKIEVIAQ